MLNVQGYRIIDDSVFEHEHVGQSLISLEQHETQLISSLSVVVQSAGSFSRKVIKLWGVVINFVSIINVNR